MSRAHQCQRVYAENGDGGTVGGKGRLVPVQADQATNGEVALEGGGHGGRARRLGGGVGAGPANRRQHVVEDPALEAGNGLAGLGRDRARGPALYDGPIEPGLADDRDLLLAAKGVHRVNSLLVVSEQARQVRRVIVAEEGGGIASDEPQLAVMAKGTQNASLESV